MHSDKSDNTDNDNDSQMILIVKMSDIDIYLFSLLAMTLAWFTSHAQLW